MSRYFLEVSYKGTNYSGFQIQQNANSIQAEIEKAFQILQKEKIGLTGSSRTDAGVHALQNFFHFDFEGEINSHFVYKINAILPGDIVVQKLIAVKQVFHCRFDAISREYKYFIYRYKDPFLKDRAFYFPYKLNTELMQQAADMIETYSDFTSFSKRNTQAKTFNCCIM
jgi:tRNA pseudouridine38-40 synthase